MPKILPKGGDEPETPTCGQSHTGHAMSFRALKTFQTVYEESSYTNASISMNTSRRTVMKLVHDLEEFLGTRLFAEERNGRVSSTPFGERFFYDMRFLESAMDRFEEKVDAIRSHRRVLKIGIPALVFRTQLFRSHFRWLRSFENFRVKYVQCDPQNAAKSLASGEVDWFFDFQALEGQRFVSEKTGEVSSATYVRKGSQPGNSSGAYQVLPRGIGPVALSPEVVGLEESQWLRWLDHPAECEPGTVITAPRISADLPYWTELQDENHYTTALGLYATRLRQHPYEFLPGLAGKLAARSKTR